MNFLNNSYTAHLGLHFFLVRHILLTGLSLIPVCTSPLIRALRFDSPDWQLQWRDTGGTVWTILFFSTLLYYNTLHLFHTLLFYYTLIFYQLNITLLQYSALLPTSILLLYSSTILFSLPILY